jgi:hypothetical protein
MRYDHSTERRGIVAEIKKLIVGQLTWVFPFQETIFSQKSVRVL